MNPVDVATRDLEILVSHGRKIRRVHVDEDEDGRVQLVITFEGNTVDPVTGMHVERPA